MAMPGGPASYRLQRCVHRRVGLALLLQWFSRVQAEGWRTGTGAAAGRAAARPTRAVSQGGPGAAHGNGGWGLAAGDAGRRRARARGAGPGAAADARASKRGQSALQRGGLFEGTTTRAKRAARAGRGPLAPTERQCGGGSGHAAAPRRARVILATRGGAAAAAARPRAGTLGSWQEGHGARRCGGGAGARGGRVCPMQRPRGKRGGGRGVLSPARARGRGEFQVPRKPAPKRPPRGAAAAPAGRGRVGGCLVGGGREGARSEIQSPPAPRPRRPARAAGAAAAGAGPDRGRGLFLVQRGGVCRPRAPTRRAPAGARAGRRAPPARGRRLRAGGASALQGAQKGARAPGRRRGSNRCAVSTPRAGSCAGLASKLGLGGVRRARACACAHTHTLKGGGPAGAAVGVRAHKGGPLTARAPKISRGAGRGAGEGSAQGAAVPWPRAPATAAGGLTRSTGHRRRPCGPGRRRSRRRRRRCPPARRPPRRAPAPPSPRRRAASPRRGA
jgi:hypothetical protein